MFLQELYSTLPLPSPITHIYPLVVLDTSLSPFQMHPEVLNGAKVRGMGRSEKDLNVIVFKPLYCPFGGVFGDIIPLLLCCLQLLKAFHQFIIQNVTVLLCICDPLNLYELPYPIPPHTPPYHKIILSSMLDNGLAYLGQPDPVIITYEHMIRSLRVGRGPLVF
jgi:hypothetical protein